MVCRYCHTGIEWRRAALRSTMSGWYSRKSGLICRSHNNDLHALDLQSLPHLRRWLAS